jgi:hypothetical protein
LPVLTALQGRQQVRRCLERPCQARGRLST